MHDAARVGGLDGRGYLSADLQRLASRERASGKALRERLPLDELVYEVVRALHVLEPIDAGDVRMVEGGEQLRLALEAREALGVGGEHWRKGLDGDGAVEAGVAGAIHLSHAPGTLRRDNLVIADAGTGHKPHGR